MNSLKLFVSINTVGVWVGVIMLLVTTIEPPALLPVTWHVIDCPISAGCVTYY
jgi:hypothetical protein